MTNGTFRGSSVGYDQGAHLSRDLRALGFFLRFSLQLLRAPDPGESLIQQYNRDFPTSDHPSQHPLPVEYVCACRRRADGSRLAPQAPETLLKFPSMGCLVSALKHGMPNTLELSRSYRQPNSGHDAQQDGVYHSTIALSPALLVGTFPPMGTKSAVTPGPAEILVAFRFWSSVPLLPSQGCGVNAWLPADPKTWARARFHPIATWGFNWPMRLRSCLHWAALPMYTLRGGYQLTASSYLATHHR